MTNYEVTFIVDPVLSGDEISATAQTYIELLKNEGSNIVHVNELGLRPLAYEINRRQSGVYYCVEFEVEKGDFLTNMELSLRRDERIMRFLTVRLDKYGVKYNADKRSGLIGKRKPVERKRDEDEQRGNNRGDRNSRGDDRNRNNDRGGDRNRNNTPRQEAPAPAAAPAPEAPAETAAAQE
jgi:small subunit ribosomal protein S6